jgi:hypothetical protein
MTIPSTALRARFAACLSAYGVSVSDPMLDALVACTRASPNTPAAVEAYRAAFGRYPSKTLWDDMVMAVQDGVEFWGEVCQSWHMRGYNPRNYAGMFAWFKAGHIPPAGPRQQGNEPRGFAGVRDFMAAQKGPQNDGDVPARSEFRHGND